MNILDKELAKEAGVANKDSEEYTDFNLKAMHQTFGTGKNRKSMLCSEGVSLKKLVELSK